MSIQSKSKGEWTNMNYTLYAYSYEFIPIFPMANLQAYLQ